MQLINGFKSDFKWGSSTNAQQFEGASNVGGKGISIADTRSIASMPEESNFDDFKIASDHYHNLKKDIQYYGEMGFKIYRFTMSWTRIFPNGDDKEPNKEGLDFYNRMLIELEKYNIEPVITLYAYDLPEHLLEKYNGWMNREIIKDYERYVKTVVTYFKERVKYWVPFNEQNYLLMDSEYMSGYATKNPKELFKMQHHFNLSYATAVKIVHSIDSKAMVGANMGAACAYPMTCRPADVEKSDEIMKYIGYGPADVYFKGKYSSFYLRRFKDVNFDELIKPGDVELLSAVNPDFMSLTYYMSSAIDASKGDDASTPLESIQASNPYCETTEWGWTIDPYGFKHFLEDFYQRYNLPILILENGMGARDILEKDGTINDSYRIKYLAEHINKMREAVEDGVDIIGYLTWSATDLYSTRDGFEKRYGFVYVDRNQELKRIKKRSFYWYKKVIANNGSDLSM